MPVKSGVPVRVRIQVAGISLHISDTMIKYEKQQKKCDRGISRDVGLFECGEVVVC